MSKFFEVPESKEKETIELLSKANIPYTEYTGVIDIVTSKTFDLVFENGKETKDKLLDRGRNIIDKILDVAISKL